MENLFAGKIWKYEDICNDPPQGAFDIRRCLFCCSDLLLLPIKTYDIGGKHVTEWWRPSLYVNTDEELSYALCTTCGWWNVFKSRLIRTKRGLDEAWYGYSASLKELDISDLTLPLNEIRLYLIAKYDERFCIHPRRFEELVASVFKDLGYFARVTALSRDDGIDVILDGPDEALIGVQVKRSKNTIKVEQIRSLTGALVIGGFTRGIFVTTSSFQAGVKRTANLSAARGIPVELIDASKFFDALKLSQVALEEVHLQNWPPKKLPRLHLITRHNLNSL